MSASNLTAPAVLKLENVSSKYGAPMGRPDALPDDILARGALNIQALAWEDGDYDTGGAYWGGGSGDFIFCAWGDLEGEENSTQLFVRAKNLADAKLQVLATLPNVTFNPENKTDWRNLDAFTLTYIACALWSITDNADESGGDPLDANYSGDDLTPEALKATADDCAAFQRDNAELLALAGNAEQNGHDFWLTRNRHGAGFLDRGYASEIGRPLTDAAHVYGSVDLYVTDEGQVSL